MFGWNAEKVWKNAAEINTALKKHGDRLVSQVDFDKFLENPRELIDSLYKNKGHLLPSLWEKHLANALHMNAMERKCSGVPSEHISSMNHPHFGRFRNGQVVSFRCMIQNRLDSDFTTSYVTVKDPITNVEYDKPTVFSEITKDIVSLPTEEGLVEREIFLAITPPGENLKAFNCPWTQTDEYVAPENKRTKLDEDLKDCVNLPDFKELASYLFTNAGEAKAVACFLKILRDCNTEEVKPNDLVEVVGVIYGEVYSEETEDENPILHDVPNEYYKIPIMHVFSCTKLADGHPKLPLIEGKIFSLLRTEMNMAHNAELLKKILTHCFGGDEIIASYMMVALVAKVVQRNVSVDGPVGRCTLNIHGMTEDSPFLELVLKVMKKLVPRVVVVDLALSKMNAVRFTPRESTPSKLEPGLFQIANGTQMILNEVSMTTGMFNDIGIDNLKALTKLVTEQEVSYDYQYQFPTLHTNVPIISLSNSPSIMPSDLDISFKPPTDVQEFQGCAANVWSWMSKHGEDLRDYLCFLKSIDLAEHQVFESDTISEWFQTYFETQNRTLETRMTPASFSTFITACRLWCILNGKVSIDREGFEFWKQLEAAKLLRPGVE